MKRQNIIIDCDPGHDDAIALLLACYSPQLNLLGVSSINPHKVHAIDTTAAGDSYLGAFVTKLSQGCSVIDAMEFASLASSYTVTKRGAIIALPYISDLE